ncbi:fungal-specific transcription factor domain-containing protein [Penicillium sp. IBT 18751x]|nr:fungal-specific transcription factor domain-containing protein [Penicillium sp. IBT 18751x]
MHHFHHHVSGKLAWVDGPTNPWRQVIIPLAWSSATVLSSVLSLSSEDLAAKFSQDHPRRHQLQRLSLRLRSEALRSLASQISQMRQQNPSTSIKPIQTQSALASTLILYNVELLGAQSGQWRVHLQGARTILQWKEQSFPRAALSDEIDSFLLYEQYFASVFAGLTSFDTPHEAEKDIQHIDDTAVLSDFINIMNRLTRIERLQYNQKYNVDPALLETLTQELDEAKIRMVRLSEIFQFQTEDAKQSFLHLVNIFHDASLIYMYQILTDDPAVKERLQLLRDAILRHSHSLSQSGSFANDLVWPLFIAGTECRGDWEKQEIVVRELEVVMQVSWNLDRRKVLSFLREFWALEREGPVTWIQFMREKAPGSTIMIL